MASYKKPAKAVRKIGPAVRRPGASTGDQNGWVGIPERPIGGKKPPVGKTRPPRRMPPTPRYQIPGGENPLGSTQINDMVFRGYGVKKTSSQASKPAATQKKASTRRRYV